MCQFVTACQCWLFYTTRSRSLSCSGLCATSYAQQQCIRCCHALNIVLHHIFCAQLLHISQFVTSSKAVRPWSTEKSCKLSTSVCNHRHCFCHAVLSPLATCHQHHPGIFLSMQIALVTKSMHCCRASLGSHCLKILGCSMLESTWQTISVQATSTFGA